MSILALQSTSCRICPTPFYHNFVTWMVRSRALSYVANSCGSLSLAVCTTVW